MSTSIQIETIGTNPYAPTGSADVNLYDFNGCTGLTLAELTMAVCIRQAALIESQSVVQMNKINASASWLEALAYVGEQILSKNSITATINLGKTSYVPTQVSAKTTIKDFLLNEMGLEESQLPTSLSTTDDKTKCYELLETEMTSSTTTNQQQMIELQSLLSRRDSAYNCSASIVKNLGTTMLSTAGNF